MKETIGIEFNGHFPLDGKLRRDDFSLIHSMKPVILSILLISRMDILGFIKLLKMEYPDGWAFRRKINPEVYMIA